MSPIRLFAAAAVAAPLLLLASPARAASSYDGCAGFITTLPATISTQGVWCFNKDLGTGLATGAAITVTTNNVTIDCNGFKLGGLAAGSGTGTTGITATDRSNVTVRDCNIRGFLNGLSLQGNGGGHVVERNRFEGNLAAGMVVSGDGSVVRENLVRDTGGTTATSPDFIFGIAALGFVDVLDNQVIATDGTQAGDGLAVGILVVGPTGNQLARNRVGPLIYPLAGQGYGVVMLSGGMVDIRDNVLAGAAEAVSVHCSTGAQTLHGNALLMGSTSGDCYDGGANYGWPVAAP